MMGKVLCRQLHATQCKLFARTTSENMAQSIEFNFSIERGSWIDTGQDVIMQLLGASTRQHEMFTHDQVG